MNRLVENLRQDATERLDDYYLRAANLLHALGGKDGNESVMLNAYERSMLRKVNSSLYRWTVCIVSEAGHGASR